jgi:Flp pilus assembly protein TadD
MNAFRSHLFAVVAVLGLVLPGLDMLRAQQKAPPTDILGGASNLFKPPQNPPINRRKNQQRSSSEAPLGEQNRPASPSPATDDTSDQVEDALALGNAARDRTPPDFASAEKAYRLAWKLNHDDPRPYVGLGNIYFDQQRYPEAAKAYKDAIKLQEPPKRLMVGALMSRGSGRSTSTVAPDYPAGDWHVYLAAAMLRQEDLFGAERELRHAVAFDPRNAISRAQLAYTLFTQKRYTEAAAFYESALQLDPTNEMYKELSKQSLLKAREAAAQDGAIAQRLEGTAWQIREAASENIVGTCHLKTGSQLDCKANGNKRPLYAGMRWKIQDGLFELQRPSPFTIDGPSCIGEIRAERIYLKCTSSEIEGNEVWTRQDRD